MTLKLYKHMTKEEKAKLFNNFTKMLIDQVEGAFAQQSAKDTRNLVEYGRNCSKAVIYYTDIEE